jgi:hypothetical protein
MKHPVLHILFLCFAKSLAAQPGFEQDSLKNLHWQVKNLLAMQLPSTLPDSLDGHAFRKAFTLKYRPDANGSYLIEVPELRRTVERDSTVSGSRYSFPLADLDWQHISLVHSEDGKAIAIALPAKSGATFLHSPPGTEPQRQVPRILIGWYEQNQAHTLQRLLPMLHRLFGMLAFGK